MKVLLLIVSRNSLVTLARFHAHQGVYKYNEMICEDAQILRWVKLSAGAICYIMHNSKQPGSQ